MDDSKKNDTNDKEESISLKDNKETSKKKKAKQIILENIDLGTTPINISSSKYEFLEFLDYQSLPPHIKNRIKMISIIAVVIIVFIILLTLKGKFHHNNIEISENNNNSNLISNKNPPINSNLPSPTLSSLNNNVTSVSASSSKKGG